MKRLIVCCDGTWNNPEQEDNGLPAPTNVFKLSNSIAPEGPDGIDQQVYYHPGVGGEGGLLRPIVGGAFGVGISRHICSAYSWLANNYQEGDELYLYGFSRGAFTARSLAGFINRGLLNLSGLSSKEAWERVHFAYDHGYRKGVAKLKDLQKPGWTFFDDPAGTPIRFLGVWDTVGALGIPDDLEILNFFDDKSKWEFFDTTLNNHVQTARHAMAIDEIRSSFSVTRWENSDSHADCREVWFPGVHCDVGGGYGQCDLSNGALLWMMAESEKAGLAFREGVKQSIKANPLGIMHNSFKGAFKALRCRPRSIAAICEENSRLFDPGVFLRQRQSPIDHPPYHPTRLLKPRESCTIDIFAAERWNATGIFLGKGQSYTFSASGEWKDSKDVCDWNGTENEKHTLGDIARAAGSFIGHLEKTFKDITKNKSTDFLLTKRVEKFPWFVLVGAIANDAGSERSVSNDGSPQPHQYVQLPLYQRGKEPLTIEHPGYLYCFANDVWSLYENNSGSIQLTVTRVS